MNIVEFKNVSKIYNTGEQKFKALDEVNLELEKGKFVVILRAIRSRKIYTTKPFRRIR